MPCRKCGKKKYKLGNGPCMYRSLKSCKKALQAYQIKITKKQNIGANGYDQASEEDVEEILSSPYEKILESLRKQQRRRRAMWKIASEE